MRKLFLIGLALLFAQGLWAQTDGSTAILSFMEEKHDFGDIHQGDVVSHIFKFENTGNVPLILTNISVTCGCTAPEWPRDPIMPGNTGEILIKFNSAGKSGIQNKVITVFSNSSEPQKRIQITSNVLPKKEEGN